MNGGSENLGGVQVTDEAVSTCAACVVTKDTLVKPADATGFAVAIRAVLRLVDVRWDSARL